MHQEVANDMQQEVINDNKRKAGAEHEEEPEHKSSTLPFQPGSGSSSSGMAGWEVITGQSEWSSVDYAKPDDEFVGECMQEMGVRRGINEAFLGSLCSVEPMKPACSW